MSEMIPIAKSFGAATPGTPVEPEVYPIEEVSQDMVHTYMTIENCTIDSIAGSKGRNFNLTDDTGTLQMRTNGMNINIGENFKYEGVTYNVTGFLAFYDNEKTGDDAEQVLQLYPCRIVSSTPGDVDCDSYCNAADVTALYNYILDGDDSEIVNGDKTYEMTSDMDNDGVINAADVTAVYNIILGM